LVCFCALYAIAAFRQLHAAVVASRGDVAGLETAVRIERASADYQNALGRMYAFNLRPEAVDHLQSAVRLNPNRAGYLIDIAAAERILSVSKPGQTYLQRAIEADPNNPAIAWEAASLSIANGQVSEATTFLKTAVEHDPSRRARAIELARRAGIDENSLGLASVGKAR
jgi:predicted Zn-dependent protease